MEYRTFELWVVQIHQKDRGYYNTDRPDGVFTTREEAEAYGKLTAAEYNASTFLSGENYTYHVETLQDAFQRVRDAAFDDGERQGARRNEDW